MFLSLSLGTARQSRIADQAEDMQEDAVGVEEAKESATLPTPPGFHLLGELARLLENDECPAVEGQKFTTLLSRRCASR